MERNQIEKIAQGLRATQRGNLGLAPDLAARSELGQPLLVENPVEGPSYWLVPVHLERRLLGFFRLGLAGELLSWGRFGQGSELCEFPLLACLARETAEAELRRAFTGQIEEITPPRLVHDGPVERIAWMSRGRTKDGTRMLLFWSFGSSYARPEGARQVPGLL